MSKEAANVNRIAATIGIAVAAILFVNIPQSLSTDVPRETVEHSKRIPEQRAIDMGIQIVWTDTPCDHDWSGCYDRARYPYEIQVSPDPSPWWQDYVILHELTHVRQFREGLPVTECGADAGAVAWGALLSGYDCPGLPSREEWELDH